MNYTHTNTFPRVSARCFSRSIRVGVERETHTSHWAHAHPPEIFSELRNFPQKKTVFFKARNGCRTAWLGIHPPGAPGHTKGTLFTRGALYFNSTFFSNLPVHHKGGRWYFYLRRIGPGKGYGYRDRYTTRWLRPYFMRPGVTHYTKTVCCPNRLSSSGREFSEYSHLFW